MRVVDAFNNPVQGVTVAFASPTGTLSSPSELSLADGSAQVRGTLGTVAGTSNNTFTATALGLTNSPITFTASATAATATTLVYVSGEGQTGTVNTALGADFVVRVVDAFNNPVQGVTVAFASPTGTLSSPSELSLADGSAQVRGTLGTVAGTGNNTFTATALGLTNSPITFTASATAATATTLVYVSGEGQTGTVNTALGADLWCA